MRRILLILTAALSLAGSAVAAPRDVALAAGPDAAATWVWPVTGEVITPYRNGTDPYATGQHRGIDIAAPVGTTVRAAAAGEVRFAGIAGSSGLTIGIRTTDGYDTSYLHLSSLAVRAGARVSAGERLGAVGTTGTRSAVAPHLHFGVRDAGTRHAYHDPLAFLPPQGAPAPRPPAPIPAPGPAPAPRPGPLAPVAAPIPVRLPLGALAHTPSRTPAPSRTTAPGRAPRPYPAPGSAPDALSAPGTVAPPLAVPPRTDRVHGAQSPSSPTSHARHLTTATQRREAPTASTSGATRLGESATPSSHRIAVSHPAATPRWPGTPSAARRGPDIAWALACAGLLLAAAILGVTGDRGSERSRRPTRPAGTLRPVLGGR